MTNNEIDVCLQPSQEKYTKLDILNQNDFVVDILSGLTIDGNFSIDGNSAIRRQSRIIFALDDKLQITPKSPIWINKRFRLWNGIKDLMTDEIIWFDAGIYSMNNPSLDISVNNYTITISGLDKMAMLDGTLSGQLGTKTVINVDTPISDAIKTTVELSGETKLLIDTHTEKVPYKIEKEATDNIYNLLDELRKLYMNWKFYYDINGNFVFTKIKNHINDPVAFDFSLYNNAIIDLKPNIKYDNIKNYIKVIGRINDDKTQYSSELTVKDETHPNNLFTVEKMGEINPRKLIITEDKYFNQKQCDDRVQYEYELHSNTADTIIMTIVPLYFLDVDMIVYINRPEDNIVGKYCITNIDCGLKYSDLMVLQAYKIYM